MLLSLMILAQFVVGIGKKTVYEYLFILLSLLFVLNFFRQLHLIFFVCVLVMILLEKS